MRKYTEEIIKRDGYKDIRRVMVICGDKPACTAHQDEYKTFLKFCKKENLQIRHHDNPNLIVAERLLNSSKIQI